MAPHSLAFIAQTNDTAGQIGISTQLTVNQEPTTQDDAFHTNVTPRPTAR